MFYRLLILLSTALFFTACNSTPDVPLSPELDQYALVKENCEGLRMMPGINVPDALDKECRVFLKRLEKSNGIDYKVAHFNDDVTDPNAKPKPEFILLQTTAYRQHRKTEVDYEAFCKTINQVSLDAIAHDQLADVALTLIFPETVFTKQHYDYYTQQEKKYQEDPQYLAFQKRYSEELVEQGLVYLSQGKKKSANKVFKAAAALNNAQGAYLAGIVYEAKHVDKAIEWHTKAAEMGLKGARINLARLYNRKHQPKEAQKFYIEAAEDNDAYAQYLLYEEYKKTDNEKTNALSREWLQRSADNGFPPAEYAYGLQLLKDKKTDEAKVWLIKAQEHGISAANSTLGVLFFEDKEYPKAYGYLTAAKSSDAKYRLAEMYERGLGIEVDYYRAYMLYKEASKLGRKNTEKDIARVDKLKTEKEKAHYSADKRKERERREELVLRNGEAPILRNVRTAGMTIRLQGLATLPLGSGHGFIVHSEEGQSFYVIDAEQKANIQQYQYVDIVTKATGKPITVSDNKGLTKDIYQFIYQENSQL